MRPGLSVLVWTALLLWFSGQHGRLLLAGGGPENVVLVVNADHPGSLLIANHYIAWRKIPLGNVIYLDGVPRRTVIPLEAFQSRILRPLVDQIRERGLSDQVDYIVYSDGFPTAVLIGPHVRRFEELVQQASGQDTSLGQLYNPRASLTALTYFLPAMLADEPSYLALDANWYYRGSASRILTEPFIGEDQTKYQEGLVALEADEHENALAAFQSLAQRHPQQVAVHVQLARTYAALGDDSQTALWLARALQAGWVSRGTLESDDLIQRIADRPNIQSLLAQMPEDGLEYAPTMGFRSRNSWSPTGSINGSPDQGRNYILCTMLAVTTENGNSEREALDQLRLSAAADGTRPDGVFVFTLTGDVRTATRAAQFQPAIDRLRALGLKAEIQRRALPQRTRLAGASIGTANFDWRNANSQILPGAICENLTSLGGRFDHAGQTKLTEFLRFGAAGSSGAVIEPLAVSQKFPHAMVHVHYARGCSLAEAYYQSVAGPFQLLIVGDALCQPWANPPRFETPGWLPPESVRGVLNIPLALQDDSPAAAALELYVDGRLFATTPWPQSVRIHTEMMSDGYHELRLVAVGAGPIHSRSRIIIPLWVDNAGERVTLTSARVDYRDSDRIALSVHSNVGERWQLHHHTRVVAESSGREGDCEIPAAKLGRGPVTLQAVAFDGDGNRVASRPLTLQINGAISSEVPRPSPANPRPPGQKGRSRRDGG